MAKTKKSTKKFAPKLKGVIKQRKKRQRQSEAHRRKVAPASKKQHAQGMGVYRVNSQGTTLRQWFIRRGRREGHDHRRFVSRLLS